MPDSPIKLPTKPTVDTLDEKISGMQEAVRLIQAAMDKMPTPALVQADVDALRELTEANFKSLRELMDAKFDGNKVALDAALKTQKEGSDKIESNFTKQIDNVVTNIQTLTKSFEGTINDLKDRFNTSAGRGSALKDGWGWLVGLAALAVPIILYFATK